MAKKMYFQIEPEKFNLYDRISRTGEIDYREGETFNVEDKFYNKLILVAKRKKLKGRVIAKEQITGTKFILKFIPKEGKSPEVKIYSNKLELRSKGVISADNIVLSPKRAAGFYHSFRPEYAQTEEEFQKNVEVANQRKEEYVGCVLDFFEEAKVAANNYRNDIRQQDKEMQRSLKQLSRRLR